MIRLGTLHTEPSQASRTECDSHAEATVVGKHCLVFQDFDHPVEVAPYDPNGSKATYKTVSAALAYDNPRSGQTTLLIIHQAVHIPHMQHNLLSTMQCRLNDVQVHDTPKFLTDKPTDTTQTIIVSADDDHEDKLTIPLLLHRVNSCFETRKPTQKEFDTCPRYTLTYEEPEYDPGDSTYAEQEKQFVDAEGCLRETGDRMNTGGVIRQLCSVSQSQSTAQHFSELYSQDNAVLSGISNTLCDHEFHEDLKGQVKISSVNATPKPAGVSPETLAKNWGIGLETAKNTLKVTTQRGIRTVLHPSMSRRFRTNDRHLRYRRLPINCYTDTMFSKTASRRRNTCDQVFGTKDGWARALPMRSKAEAHYALTDLLNREGVPNTLIMDGAKEETMGKFRKKCR